MRKYPEKEIAELLKETARLELNTIRLKLVEKLLEKWL